MDMDQGPTVLDLISARTETRTLGGHTEPTAFETASRLLHAVIVSRHLIFFIIAKRLVNVHLCVRTCVIAQCVRKPIKAMSYEQLSPDLVQHDAMYYYLGNLHGTMQRNMKFCDTLQFSTM